MIYHLGNVFTFIGGIGLFLYGMKIMSEGLQKVAGSKFSNIIKALTKNKFSAILVGALVTAMIHSSGATTVMVVGFVNAGIMKLNEAVGVIMGANIGTTITAWIVSLTALSSVTEVLNPKFFAPVLFGISALIIVFAAREKTRTKANIGLGLGLLFLGLTLMASGVSAYAESKVFKDVFVVLGKNPFLAVLAGAIITIILSSSTASVSILQTLAVAGSVSKGAACFITVGQNIGTCVTTIISSIKGSKNGKRTALLHLLFNVLGGLIFSILVLIFYGYLKDFLNTKINLVQISIFHTGFNILNTLILLPFSNAMVNITKKIIKDDENASEDFNLSERTASILDERILTQPAVAISTVKKEIIYYTKYTYKNLCRAIDLIIGERNEELIRNVEMHEEEIDKTNTILYAYLSKINKLAITDRQVTEVEHLLSICTDVERIGDHAENISENATELLQADEKFSDVGLKELEEIVTLTYGSVESAIECLETKSKESIANVRRCEEKVDDLEDEYKANHIDRMSKGKCNAVAGTAFLDIIGNLERVTDHANNLADYVEAELKEMEGSK